MALHRVTAILAACATCAVAGEGDFSLHWGVVASEDQVQMGNDFAAQVHFGDVNFRRDTYFLYAHKVGMFPHEGPHVLLREPEYMQTHLNQIEVNLRRWIPDPEFDGLAII
ncbi:MAG: hypothetical protein KDA28_04215, partial [Phycisphaerales bacterium]|nr:hypothetical protein [Phycisphaerales bacterium]